MILICAPLVYLEGSIWARACNRAVRRVLVAGRLFSIQLLGDGTYVHVVVTRRLFPEKVATGGGKIVPAASSDAEVVKVIQLLFEYGYA